jgi:hypothetical protein
MVFMMVMALGECEQCCGRNNCLHLLTVVVVKATVTDGTDLVADQNQGHCNLHNTFAFALFFHSSLARQALFPSSLFSRAQVDTHSISYSTYSPSTNNVSLSPS